MIIFNKKIKLWIIKISQNNLISQMHQNIFFNKNLRKQIQVKICQLINYHQQLEVLFKLINKINAGKIKNKIFNEKIVIQKKIFGKLILVILNKNLKKLHNKIF